MLRLNASCALIHGCESGCVKASQNGGYGNRKSTLTEVVTALPRSLRRLLDRACRAIFNQELSAALGAGAIRECEDLLRRHEQDRCVAVRAAHRVIVQF